MGAKSESEASSRSRIDRLRLCFSRVGADAFLVTHLPNIRYLCGFSGSAGILLVEASQGTLFTDSRYTFQAREEVAGVRVQIAKRGLIRACCGALSKRRGRCRVAYSPSQMTVAQKTAFQNGAGGRFIWVDGGSSVEKLRAVKDKQELATMREAAELISEVFRGILVMIKPGVAELDIAAEIEYAMKKKGATGPSFDTIVASGPRSAWAHACPSPKPLRKNELVVLDQGAILRSYCSDMTRTVFLGRSPDKVRRLYQAVLEAQEAAKGAIRPGTTSGAVDAAARGVLRRYGLARYFTHSTGHGLGLEVHEMPRLGMGEKTVLEEGMVLTVEPGVYLEGMGGIRIEDDIVVASRGAVDLTTAPREFIQL
ncbi:MAG: Xaa-Pro peptidase family protein [Candidatus Acidiferrales bacterium]